MSPYPTYPMPNYQYQRPPYGFPQGPHPSFYPSPLYPAPILQLPPEEKSEKYREQEDEEFEMMIRLIDKQRNILGGFVKALDKNKDTMMNDRTKELNKHIKKLEKEGVISQLKLNNEQGRLISKGFKK